MKKQIFTLAAAAALLLWGSAPAQATLTLKLDDGNGSIVTVTDNDPNDINPAVGTIVFTGAVGPNWVINVTVGTSKPTVGSASMPVMDVSPLVSSAGAGTLDIQLSDTDFSPASPVSFTATFGGTTDGSVTFDTWADGANGLFAKTTPITSQGPYSGANQFSGSQSVIQSPGGSSYSLTLHTTVTHTANGSSGFDANLSGISSPTANCVTINAVQNVAITPVTLVVSGGCGAPYTFSATGLPNGLNIGANTGTISGTPTGSGTFPYTVTINDTCGNTNTLTCSVPVSAVTPPPCQASVCGSVFVDCNGDGFLTPGIDIGMPKVVVTLKDSKGVTVTTATTDSQGNYCFNGLAAGTYTVCISQPASCIQTAGTHVNHWLNNSYQQCWTENDGYQHCKGGDGVDRWTANDGCQHWKNSNGQDCWKDKYGKSHSQNCTYVSCDVPKGNCETVILVCGKPQTGVNFAYQGISAKAVVCVTGPSKGVCGKTGTYTCSVQNTGNACFSACQVTVCGKSYNCPALSAGQSCAFTFNHQFQYGDYGNFNCKATATCTPSYSNSNNSNNSNWFNIQNYSGFNYSKTSSSCTAQGSCNTSVGYW